VVRGLEQCRPRVRDDEGVPEHPDHHVGEVGGRSLHGEADGEQNERDREASTDKPGLVLWTLVLRLRLRHGLSHPGPPLQAHRVGSIGPG
ncbi:MAG: hypothetical protein WBD97_08850, partial [Pseudolabrys sp.]